MANDQGPVVQRALLAGELFKLRHQSRLKQEEVARALDWSPSKVIRIEGGGVGVATVDLHALLRYYDVSEPERIEALTALARGGRERGWWTSYQRDVGDVPYMTYVGYEAGASAIRHFQGSFVPALLQTEEYSEVLTSQFVDAGVDVSPFVQLRLERQSRLREGRSCPPREHYVLDQAVIDRHVGSEVDKQIMPRQLRHLIELGRNERVTIQVIPFERGAHFGQRGPFVLLEFDGDLGDVLYLENSRGGSVILTGRGDPEVVNYRDAFQRLCDEVAFDPEKSLRLIEKAAKAMS